MKKLLNIFIVIALLAIATLGCFESDSKKNNTQPPQVTDPTPPPGGIEDPSGLPVKATLITSEGTKFYDGTNFWLWKTGTTAKAKTGIYSNTNYLFALDEYGETADYRLLTATPTLITLTTSQFNPSMSAGIMAASTTIDLDAYNKWIVETIPWETAMEQGMPGVPKTDYTRLWYNGVEYGNWKLRDYSVDNFVIVNGDIFARKSPMGAWVCISDPAKTDVKYACSDFVFWNVNTTARTGKFNNVDVSWSFNFLTNPQGWIKSETLNKWYSYNGYIWDVATSTLYEQASTLWAFRSKTNRFMIVGTHFEDGENMLYFIECDTGNLVRYVPSQNAHTVLTQLYIGDGTIDTGVYMKQTLKPSIVEDDLYFIYEAHTFRYNFQSGLVALFGDNISEVMGY